MKIAKRKLYLLFLLITLVNALNLKAEEIGEVAIQKIKGKVFLLKDDKIKPIHYKVKFLRGDFELITEEKSNISFSDSYDHFYHLAGGSKVYISEENILLNDGYLWIQSLRKGEVFRVKTKNSIIGFSYGEAILIYDSLQDKTQLFTIDGDFTLENIKDVRSRKTISSGEFSIVDKKSYPSSKKNISKKSFNELILKFDDIDFLNNNSNRIFLANKNTNKIKNVNEHRVPNVSGNINNNLYYGQLKQLENEFSIISKNENKIVQNSMNLSNVPILIYRARKMKNKKRNILPMKKKKNELNNKKELLEKLKRISEQSDIKYNNNFEKSLDQAYKKDRRHDKSVEKLIDQLKTFSNEYKRKY